MFWFIDTTARNHTPKIVIIHCKMTARELVSRVLQFARIHFNDHANLVRPFVSSSNNICFITY